MHRLAVFVTVFALLGLSSSSAFAQAHSKDATRACDGSYYRNAAYAYLTGKRVKPNWDSMFTAGAKKLAINGPSLTTTLSRDRSDYTVHAGVSLPFTAIRSFARLTYTPVKNHTKSDITVCHYALKSSAKSWGSFQMSDLKSLFGRDLGGIRGKESVSVRLGGKRPPEGYRTSTVAVVFVTHFNDGTPTIKMRLASTRR